MNPWLLMKAWYRQYTGSAITFVILFSLALSLGLALVVQERAIKSSSAKVSNPFPLIIGAPGSDTTLVLSTVFLQTDFLETLPVLVWRQLQNETRIEWFAPLTFGDFYQGHPLVGTTAQMGQAVYGADIKFTSLHDAWVGADVGLAEGDEFKPEHGFAQQDEHSQLYHVAGKLPRSGTPWDRAILIAVESSWFVHGLGDGHSPPVQEHELDYVDESGHEIESAAIANDLRLGDFTDLSLLHPVSAFVVKPTSFAAAYGLRSTFRTSQTQAVFPAEVMVRLYALMGDARAVISQVTLVCEALVMVALIYGISALFALFQREMVVLRLIGASRRYLLLSAWLYVFSLMLLGSVFAFILAVVETRILSYVLAQQLHFDIATALRWQDLGFVGLILLIGSVVALIPAWRVFRYSGRKLLLQEH
ncbi:MAG: FtsX-like permease family protein [Reinekea sp.]|jgi:putative ABC transport system permease protein